MSFTHIVIGEVVPKNLGIERSDQLAIISAPALLLFYKVSLPFVYVIERSASAISRLLGLKGHQHGGGHSAEELQLLVSSSRHAGHLLDFEESAIQRVLTLDDFYAREAMVPRNSVVSISVDATLDHALQLLSEHQYSRYPIYERTPENIIGFLLAKDLLREWYERRRATAKRRPTQPFHLRRLLRKPLVIPETKPLSELVDVFRKSHKHLGVVVDEFGTIVGIITLEDVLEQIVGEIEDEYDARRPEPPTEARVIEFEGTIGIRDLETHYDIELPGDAGFETLAGFMLFRLEHVPKVGEQVEHAGIRFTILEMDRNRIAKVKAERL
jgi:CBS domain containing-hemolysin-like protein